MYIQRSLRQLQGVLLPCAIVLTAYLYLYPFLLGCGFPSANSQSRESDNITPFRLLVLADPQLEGDSSLPDPEDALLARIQLHAERIRNAPVTNWTRTFAEVTQEVLGEDIPRSLWAVRKSLDLFGNDYYLSHIYRTLHWWSKPTHVTVLGDLIGSQWVNDDEFRWRSWRYWNRVFAGSRKVDEDVMSLHLQDTDKQHAIPIDDQGRDWTRQIINIVGNHDIGYAGDITPERIERFEREFGKVNWDVHFSYPVDKLPQNYSGETPSVHMIVLNSMILDTPALHESIQSQTYDYLNGLISSRLDSVEQRNATFSLLLTHVPLHKPQGVCVDAPLFEFWDQDEDDGRTAKKGGLREQNHLSDHSSHEGVLQGIFGMSGDQNAAAGGKGRNGLILTGHDHEGCDTVHYVLRGEEAARTTFEGKQIETELDSDPPWKWKSVHTSTFAEVSRKTNSDSEVVTSVREVTLRSMMGGYSGNAGLLSLWYDFDTSDWKYEITMCSLGVQHIWWAVHIIDLITLLVIAVRLLFVLQMPSSLGKPLPTENETREEKPKLKPLGKVGNSLTVPTAGQRHDRSPSPRRRKG